MTRGWNKTGVPAGAGTVREQGFTLVEIMIVVSIIGLLATLAVPSFINARTKSIAAACINNLRMIEAAKDQYAMDHTNQPPSVLADLVGTNAYIKNMPICGAGGNYTVGTLGGNPTCSIGGLHALP